MVENCGTKPRQKTDRTQNTVFISCCLAKIEREVEEVKRKEEKNCFRGSGKQQFSELYSGLGAGICAFLRVVDFVVVE